MVGTHRNLCENLAAHLCGQGYRAWVELRRVGVVSYGDAGRIDVLALTPWSGRTKFEMIAFEVKVSRSDLLSDLTKGKWRRYAAEYGIPRVAFACAEGIATAGDMPADAGLWVYEGGQWKRKKAPRPLVGDQRQIDSLLLLSMLTDREHSERETRRDRRVFEMLPDGFAEQVYHLPDPDFRRFVMFKLAHLMGTETAKRLARPNEEARKVEMYAEHVLKWLSEMTGSDVDYLRRAAQRDDGFQVPYQVAQVFERAKRLTDSAEVIVQLSQLMSQTMRAYNDHMMEDATDILAALAPENRRRKPSRKKGVA